MEVKIIGAGLAGLLAANMLRHRAPIVHEVKKDLPNNHSAVLRFRSGIIGDLLGIPFRKVSLIKSVVPWLNPIADALAYSEKCSGFYRSDRSILSGNVCAERFIAPPDLIRSMALPVRIKLGSTEGLESLGDGRDSIIISTIPMPTLMGLLDYPRRKDIEFNSVAGINIRATIEDCDAYVSLYVPSPEYKFNRISITGDEVIVEFAYPRATIAEVLAYKDQHNHIEQLNLALDLLSIKSRRIQDVIVSVQQYSKIQPIDDHERRTFMHWATDKFNIYSLGRYATWRPGLLLDDLVKDIRLIDSWIRSGDKYSVARNR